VSPIPAILFLSGDDLPNMNTKRKVYVSRPWADGAEYLFGHKYSDKYTLVANPEACDMIVFNGGEDINPDLYGQPAIPATHFNQRRDDFELAELRRAPKNAFKFGICRGGQLLNALAGGSLWQHTDKHGGRHPIKCHISGRELITSSVHHQQFILGPNALLVASARVSSIRKGYNAFEQVSESSDPDPEVVWYGKVENHPRTGLNASRSLCIQGHPEYDGYGDFTEYCMGLIDHFWES